MKQNSLCINSITKKKPLITVKFGTNQTYLEKGIVDMLNLSEFLQYTMSKYLNGWMTGI